MKIEHIAIWVENLNVMRDFYIEYFNAKSNDLYHNPRKEFKSYFLTFDSGARAELMQKPHLRKLTNSDDAIVGYAHFAMSLGSAEIVDELTERLRDDGYIIVGEPRTTGDGYYESVIQDPEGNRIELTA